MSEEIDREKAWQMLQNHGLRAEQDSLANKQDFLFGGVNRQAPHWGPQYFPRLWTLQAVNTNAQYVPSGSQIYVDMGAAENSDCKISGNDIDLHATVKGTFRITARVNAYFSTTNWNYTVNQWVTLFTYARLLFTNNGTDVSPDCKQSVWFYNYAGYTSGDLYLQMWLDHVFCQDDNTPPADITSIAGTIQLRCEHPWTQINGKEDLKITSVVTQVQRLRAPQKIETY